VIVRSLPEGWEIIFHRSHALLATQIALAWDRKDEVVRVPETIAAISQHDDLEREFEGGHLSPAGAPLDFTLRKRDDETEIPRWERLLEDALYRGRWVALLTGMHILFLNQDKAGDSACLDAFCRDLKKQVTGWRKELGVSAADAECSYAFVQWCDRLSLILAQDEIPKGGRRLEVSVGPDGRRYDLRREEQDERILIEPWPFTPDEFIVSCDVRMLTQLYFPSDEEFCDRLKEAPVLTRTWRLKNPES
jgi:hypothetical protein